MSQAEITSYTVVKGGHVEPGAENVIVGTDKEGDLLPPESVGNFTLIDGKRFKAGWAVPISVVEETVGGIPTKKPKFCVVELDGFRDYDVIVRTTTKPRGRPSKTDEATTLGADLDEKEAASKAVEWMLEHPIEPQVSIPTRDISAESSFDDLHAQFERMRAGSHLAIQHYEGHFEVLHELKIQHPWDEGYLLEHSSGVLFRLLKNSGTLDKATLYLQPLHGHATAISSVTVSNEHNLRDSVDKSTYNTVKEAVGEMIARLTPGELPKFEAIEVETVEDGFVNPSETDDLDPNQRNSATFIDDSEAGKWEPLPEEVQAPLEDGEYYIATKNGLYKASDNYLLSQVVDQKTWEGTLPELEAEAIPTGEFELKTPIETPEDPPGLDDPVTEIPYVGEARAENIPANTVGEALDRGLPFFDVPANGMRKILDAVHGMDHSKRFGTIAKFSILGMLGGVGHDINGEQIGTIASLILDDLDERVIEWAWFGAGYGIKNEYRANIDETPIHDGFAVGVGTPETGDIRPYLESKEGEVTEVPIEDLRSPTTNVNSVAIGNENENVWTDLPSNLFEFLIHTLQTDFSDPDILEEHASIYLLQTEKKEKRFIELRHPETNTVAVVQPERTAGPTGRINFEEWAPWAGE
ncbi:hypothetical protein RH831_10845 [Halodesulfurarchaeum sp. HSR-GB]|uniref:hypothetical protein n=1 Tax=Halodesulfurarchaeum sp. HSR-GB TaxID=3074077 RepID=UPI0028589CC1|nr:hypothetical protein [Halodesulfurarchaeum sp. HSR-GB]MDR5657673.1 hypothetical protein [Halodesulfurarchaeum sp. HSR-GB]